MFLKIKKKQFKVLEEEITKIENERDYNINKIESIRKLT